MKILEHYFDPMSLQKLFFDSKKYYYLVTGNVTDVKTLKELSTMMNRRKCDSVTGSPNGILDDKGRVVRAMTTVLLL